MSTQAGTSLGSTLGLTRTTVGPLVHLHVPIWVFAFDPRRIVWANRAGLDLWRASDVADLAARSHRPESASSRDRLSHFHRRLLGGETIVEAWTFYPKDEPLTAQVRLQLCAWEDDPNAMLVEVLSAQAPQDLDRVRQADGLLHSPTAAVLVGEDGSLLFRNPAAESLFHRLGLSGSWFTLLDPPDRATAILADGLAEEATGPFDFVLHDRDGRSVSLSLETRRARDPASGAIAMYAYFSDVTDRETARRALEGQAAFIETVLDTSPNLVFVKNRSGAFTYVNRAVETLFDRSRAELVGQANSAVHVHDSEVDFFDETDRRVIDGGETVVVEEPFTDTEGRQRTYRTIKTPLVRPDGPVECLGISLDITDFRAAERALVEAKRAAERASEAKSQFLATMSHEIRTPMNGVIGMAQVLQSSELTPDQAEMLGIIQSSAEALLTLINDILDFSKIEAGHVALEPAPADPIDVVESVIELLAPKATSKGLEFALVVDPSVPRRLTIDAGRVRQVLVNLIGNAIKFTAEGGIAIMVSLAGRAPETFFDVSVQDTGIGISPDDQQRLFEPFAQVDQSNARRFGGTGLGLTISRRLAEAMGGRIGLTSTPGVGSVFTFAIPAIEATEDEAEAPVDLPHDLRAFVVGMPAPLGGSLALQMLLWGIEARSVDRVQDVAAGTDDRPLVLLMPVERIDAEVSALAARWKAKVLAVANRGSSATADAHLTLNKPVRSSDLLDALVGLIGPALPAARSRRPPPEPRPHPSTALRVLVAEDNQVNQQVIDRMLRNDGHRVELVSTGVDALVALERQPFDVVLMDIQMPEMDGLEATRVLRRRRDPSRDTPVIAMTANVLPGAIEECLAAGMNGYLSKPVDRTTLSVALARLVTPEPTGIEPAVLGERARKRAEPGEAEGAVDDRLDTARLALLAEDFAPTEILSLVDAFATDQAHRLPEAMAALERGDTDRMQRALHALKSAAGNVGLARVAGMAVDLETDLRGGRQPSGEALSAFAAALAEDLAAVRHRLATDGSEEGDRKRGELA